MLHSAAAKTGALSGDFEWRFRSLEITMDHMGNIASSEVESGIGTVDAK